MSTTNYDRIKRTGDFLVAGTLLVLTSPLQLAVAAAVAGDVGRPVLFRQVRPGLAEAPFELIKFRTMHYVDPEAGLVTDEERLTTLGRFLRSTSLDELPTLWNVLRGHMSLVGPRPLLMAYLPRYTGHQRRRHEVRPGITGLAQVEGRNSVDWQERLHLDVTYVDRIGALLDLQILWRTFRLVVKRTGVSAVGYATMPEFQGSTQSPRACRG